KAYGFPEAPFLNYSRLCLASYREAELQIKTKRSESRRTFRKGRRQSRNRFFSTGSFRVDNDFKQLTQG
ncbi:MAG TPA: hypothetical protein VIV66_08070, partial [Pyrinomonadaceae bacterium]